MWGSDFMTIEHDYVAKWEDARQAMTSGFDIISEAMQDTETYDVAIATMAEIRDCLDDFVSVLITKGLTG